MLYLISSLYGGYADSKRVFGSLNRAVGPKHEWTKLLVIRVIRVISAWVRAHSCRERSNRSGMSGVLRSLASAFLEDPEKRDAAWEAHVRRMQGDAEQLYVLLFSVTLAGLH